MGFNGVEPERHYWNDVVNTAIHHPHLRLIVGYMYIYNMCIYIYIHTYTCMYRYKYIINNLYVNISRYLYVCVQLHTRVYLYIYIYTYVYVYLHIYICIYMCLYVCVCMVCYVRLGYVISLYAMPCNVKSCHAM